ncbi:transglutaminase domain-containing protein [Paenibacillus wynnii]|uniref:transglutaminase domain-containing protein n=1 Tax=Paenibacillus wynnii TaxID=268407 RepID=UPI00278DE17C|nr:transglutaminase domain-containing protein [Paenibacillus wynnii]MDQ0193870.1 putative membrane protein required for colicin V production [Paenibacillus wynnii]
MLNGWLERLSEANVISVALLLIVAFSVVQGLSRGFFISIGKLLGLLGSGLITIVSLFLAVLGTLYLSPRIQQWAAEIKLPDIELNAWQQIYYTGTSVLSESTWVRFIVILMVSYSIIRLILGFLSPLLPLQRRRPLRMGDRKVTSLSRLGGGLIGALIGVSRCLVIIIVLFVAVGLNPDSGFSRYVESSPVYRGSAAAVIEPIAGKTVQAKLPILTQIVAAEMDDILRRKYEVIDREIPSDIKGAAVKIVGKSNSEEEKARLLYDWVGTRISYDYAKAENYEQNRIWHEQSPQDTFDTRLGVCIDYARLYAVMARSQNLQVRVVTGQGYDGVGGYGPHAWNEVYIDERKTWIPLDSTWAQSGDWFNPTDFSDTHLRESVL